MSEPKFTPGPWGIGQCAGDVNFGPLENDHMGYIGRIYSDHDMNFDDEQVANANLIVTAPDMYEALARLLEVIDRNSTGSYGDAEDNAREILKKARGEK